MEDCLFCNIAAKKIQSRIGTENESVVAFEDIHPQAPTHVLIVPRKHIATLNDVQPADSGLLGELVMTGVAIARDRNLSSPGFRLVWNTNAGAGQSVFHIH